MSKQLANSVDIDVVSDLMANQFMVQLRALVYEDPTKFATKEYVVEEKQAHPTWKHALIASLPETALFRRRFLGFYWNINPLYKTTFATHTVKLEGRALFPDMDRIYPDQFGPVQYVVQAHTDIYRPETTY